MDFDNPHALKISQTLRGGRAQDKISVDTLPVHRLFVAGVLGCRRRDDVHDGRNALGCDAHADLDFGNLALLQIQDEELAHVYEKILVINLMHLGDLMLVTPTLRTLRKNFPAAQIAMLADKKLGDLVRFNKHIDECILIDKKGVDDNFFSFVKFIFKLREKNFDLVINLHRNERASALAAFSGAKKIVGYSKPLFSFFFDKVMPNPSIARHVKEGFKTKYFPGTKHQVHSHFDVLREACGITEFDDGGLEMWIDDATKLEATKIFHENFPAACVEKMEEKNNSLLKIFTGKFSLAMVAGFLDKCVLFLTTDSGPMHIGVARNIPIVTMFGASPVPGFYPYDAKDILIQSPEPCHPCGQHTCPKTGEENLACMKKIPVNVVMRYVDEILESYGQPAEEIPRVYGAYQCRVIKL